MVVVRLKLAGKLDGEQVARLADKARKTVASGLVKGHWVLSGQMVRLGGWDLGKWLIND